MHQTIPVSVISRVVKAVPHLQTMAETIERMKFSRAVGSIEKHFASNAMSVSAICDVLSGHEINQLSKCCVGQKFGGGSRGK